ncbi:hypothetical protein KSD_22720 [Ktedonobacter sp. SOSP1-85]|uniref:hypothetical protein n=1 Tax=Ktedonobacter sp. SOSP1-85 TaxID=2778367 RepID=UPI0019154F9D|nr:hypothetical protein [Ktedonobacter sp. SOSP1-85]GHO74501.1 hypothetical protein KSD_22720 [Ktedonobacter sp. SOSP1-85]
MQQTPEEEAKTGPGQSAQPLYEYPAPTASQATPPQQGESQSPSVDMPPEEEEHKQPGTIPEQYGSVAAAPNEDRPAQEVSEEDIRSGLVYPPPPSFYAQMPEPTSVEREPTPPSRPEETPWSTFPPVPARGNPGPQGPQQFQGGPQFAPAAPFAPFPAPGLPVRRRANKWVWLSLAIFGVIALVSCGLCTWTASSVMAPVVLQTTGSLTTINNYYTAIQSRNYDEAFSYIEPKGRLQGLTREQFIAEAKARDARYGQVLSFTPRTNQVSAQPSAQGLSNLKVTFDITRSKLKYAVTLTVEKVGNQYKIVDYQQV